MPIHFSPLSGPCTSIYEKHYFTPPPNRSDSLAFKRADVETRYNVAKVPRSPSAAPLNPMNARALTCLLAGLLLGQGQLSRAADNPPGGSREAPIREAVTRSLPFLETKGVAW